MTVRELIIELESIKADNAEVLVSVSPIKLSMPPILSFTEKRILGGATTQIVEISSSEQNVSRVLPKLMREGTMKYRILAYIDENLKRDISLQEVLSHFSKFAPQVVRTTVSALYNERRIKRPARSVYRSCVDTMTAAGGPQ